MLRSLAAKAVVPVALAVTGFVAVCCLLLHEWIKKDLTRATIAQEIHLADTIIRSTRNTMLKSDREALEQTIKDIGEQEGVEHVRIFNKKGRIMLSDSPEEVNSQVNQEAEGCVECHSSTRPRVHMGPEDRARDFVNEKGQRVLAITTPIYNEASCLQSACHVHPQETRVLGTLDIGLSRAPLEESLATLSRRLILFSMMILFLSVVGVLALLRRSVFVPISKLVSYAEAMARGDSPGPPPRGAREIERVVKALRTMKRGGQGQPPRKADGPQ